MGKLGFFFYINLGIFLPVKTMRSGFSAAMTRDMKAVVLRSEQWAFWLGSTSRHRVVAPFPKCISATCSILNSPFTPNLSFRRCCADAGTKQKLTRAVERRKKSNKVLLFRLSAIVLGPRETMSGLDRSLGVEKFQTSVCRRNKPKEGTLTIDKESF